MRTKNSLLVVASVVAAVFAFALWKFPPGSSADMAGWVQAFGAVLAIGLAVWLQYDAATDRQVQAAKVARAFAGQIVLSTDGLQMACRSQHWTEYVAMRQLLDDTLAMTVPMGDLHGDLVALVLTIRGITIRALSDAPLNTSTLNWQHLETQFGNAGHDVRHAMLQARINPPPKAFSP